jgi:glucosamine--fructose-6-phosphate aminotransferase (isomerizing)
MAAGARRAVGASHAHEFASVVPLLAPGDAVVAFSQSGETIDVLDAVRAARNQGALTAALVNVPGSTLTREVGLPLLLGAGPETSVLSTKTFTAKVAYVLLATGALGGDARRHVATLQQAADDMEALRDDGRLDAVRTLACRIADRDHLFVLGRGWGYPLALEAALKIKEVSYIHAEGFPAGELKHGVIALIEPGAPVIVFDPDGTDEAPMLVSAGEVKARGAYVIGVGPRNHDVFDAHLPVRARDRAYLPAALLPVQLLAYELALLRGTDPDKPRNLAKSVTVR